MDPLYLAFFKLDIHSLKLFMKSIFMVDEIRRLVTESLIPYFKRSQLHNKINKLHAGK
jgi:hypothetical protein